MISAKSTLRGAATLFVVQDVLKSVAHYRDVLGFTVEFTYGEPTFYAGVERDDVTIHLQAARQTKRHVGQGAINVFVTFSLTNRGMCRFWVGERKKPKRQPPYHVILWNDDEHTYEYVIGMLMQLFAYPPEKGFLMAKEVDTQGKVIVLTTTREHAELKRDQIHAFGKDDLIAGCKGSMSATIEPAE